LFETILNWHPIFVHFTVSLPLASIGLLVITQFIESPLKDQWLLVSRWLFWFGAVFTFITGLTGLYAYYTIAYDKLSDVATSKAVFTISLFTALAVWSIRWKRIKQNTEHNILINIT